MDSTPAASPSAGGAPSNGHTASPTATPAPTTSTSASSAASSTMNTPTVRPAKRQRPADDDIDGADFSAAQALPPSGTNSNAARPPPPATATPRPAPPRPAPPAASPSRAPPTPANIFGERAIPDVHRQIADFIYVTLNEHRPPLALDAPVEIEAKLGRIIDKRTGQRLALPVRSETVVVDATELRFESDMTVAQHKAFNGVLNQLVQRGKLRYRHSKEIDVFYRKGRDDKVRVTLEGKTRQVLPGRTITKQRLASLDVYCPSAPLDYRISINLEIPTKIPTEVMPDTRERHKDRLSYTHELVQVDLTQVTIKVGPNDPNPQLSHELEVEFIDAAKAILHEKQVMDQRGPQGGSRLLENIVHLVENVRLLADKARPF
ncbi:mRNA-capping enzyme subunit beta [Allomyces javanicus]|nr:mRNA-capping enzyme subunit beta [Allomyces javanicus]